MEPTQRWGQDWTINKPRLSLPSWSYSLLGEWTIKKETNIWVKYLEFWWHAKQEMHVYWEEDNEEEPAVKGWSGKGPLWVGTFSLSPDVGEDPSPRRVWGPVPGRGKRYTEEKNLALSRTDSTSTLKEHGKRGLEGGEEAEAGTQVWTWISGWWEASKWA